MDDHGDSCFILLIALIIHLTEILGFKGILMLGLLIFCIICEYEIRTAQQLMDALHNKMRHEQEKRTQEIKLKPP